MIGQSLGHYQVLERIGAGGMGVVYKARDTHLDRLVALKVLPAEKVADPDRKRRLAQEARAASALNHPNIVVIHDIARVGEVDFIVMECVGGKTLAELIPRRGMRLSLALRYAVPIADALARAHSAGIIHRDLKPSNVMVDEHGLVKVLDFGLAKLTEAAESEAETATARTGAGTVLGTAAYMSPEQAEGRPIDTRSDIFSFGSMLYEMLTGRRAFPGDTRASVLASILRDEPTPFSQAAEGLPRDAERILRRCLRKDAEHRFQTMADLRVALEELLQESDSGALIGPVRGRTRGRAYWPLALTAILPFVAVASWYTWRSLRTAVPAPRVIPLTAYPGRERHPAFSPDGRQVAFCWDGDREDNEDIYVRLVGSEAPLRLTTDEAPDRSPVWSPDGAQVAFVRDRGDQAQVYVAPALGGQEKKLADFRTVPRHFATMAPAISWSPDGKWLAVPELEPDGTNGIFLVPADRGEKRKLVSRRVSEGRFHWPAFSPTGDFLAYAILTGERSGDVHVLELDANSAANGEARRLTYQGVVIEGLAWAPDGQSLVYSASQGFGGDFYLWRVPVSGRAAPERQELIGARVRFPSFARMGHRLAYSRYDGDADIWKFEAGGAPQRFLSSTRSEYDAQFSPDGTRIAFSTDRSGRGSELWVASRDGTNLARLSEPTGYRLGSPRWSPDSQWIVYDAQAADGRYDIYRIDAAGGQARCLTPQGSDEVLPSWSRDGRFVYFSSNRSGAYEVRRQPAAGGEDVQVTRDGGFEAWESWDGKTLYYTKHSSTYSSPLFSQPSAGGEERQLLESVHLLSFTVAANGVYHVVKRRSQRSFEIRLFDLATGKDRVLHTVDLSPMQGLTVSPDGKTILYSAVAAYNEDLMLVEDFR